VGTNERLRFYLQNLPRLAVGRAYSYQTRRRPLFFIPRAAILRGGALSGPFHPNAGRHEDMTITADFSCRGHSARRPVRPPSAASRVAGPRSAGRRLAGPQPPAFRDALSLSPFRLPEPEPDVAQRPHPPKGPFLGPRSFLRAHRVAGLYPIPWFFCWFWRHRLRFRPRMSVPLGFQMNV
jgi:hypothetical protein